MRQRDEAKEHAIREKAIEIVINEGFDSLSMQKLAKSAGVSPATIYIYFKDREDLIEQIIQVEARKNTDAMMRDFDPQMSFEEGLRIQWRNRSRHYLENPMSMQFLEQVRNSPGREEKYKMDPAFLYAMRTFAHNAIERGELRQLPLEIFWSIAYAPLYQLVKFHLSHRGLGPSPVRFVLDDDGIEQTFQLVLKALRP